MYSYAPLADDCIRLLAIEPGLPDEQVECRLLEAPLSGPPLYHAVSYAWGRDDPRAPRWTIRCNDADMPVGKTALHLIKSLRPLPARRSDLSWAQAHDLHSSTNAWAAFARNRFEERDGGFGREGEGGRGPLLVWIDAICINQEDPAEKARQVGLMDVIYRTAHSVKVWLGNPETTGALRHADTKAEGVLHPVVKALPFMLTPFVAVPVYLAGLAIERWMPVLGRHHGGGERGGGTLSTFHIGSYGSMPVVLSFIAQALRNVEVDQNKDLLSTSPELSGAIDAKAATPLRNEMHGFLSPQSPDWVVVANFFGSPWFSRIWVVQEIALARHAVVIVGDWEIEWAALGRAALWFQNHGYGLPASTTGGVEFGRRIVPHALSSSRNDPLPIAMAAELWKFCQGEVYEKWGLSKQRGLGLLDLLRGFRTRGASVQRDRLYATYSLARETNGGNFRTNLRGQLQKRRLDPLLEPDYTTNKSLADVYADAARFLIIDQGNLDVLSYVGSRPATDVGDPNMGKHSHWPSWVADWSHEKLSVELINIPGAGNVYCAGSGEKLSMGSGVPDRASLSVRGVLSGKIKTYGQKLITYASGHTIYREERNFFLAARKMAHDNQQTSQHHLLNIIAAGVTDTGLPIDQDSDFAAEGLVWLDYLASSATNAPQTRFRDAFVRVCNERRFFVTQGRNDDEPPMMGLGPDNMREGDVVAVLAGAKVPFVVRLDRECSGDTGTESGDGDRRRCVLVGECYVPDLMQGEAIESANDESRDDRFVWLDLH